jgi:hypothetical protein
MNDTEMSLHEALRLAVSTMYQALDEIKQMPEGDRKYLRIPEKDLIAAVRIIDAHMREQS